MSTLATTNIKHPDSPTSQIAMTSNSMTFDASNLSFVADAFDLPDYTTIQNEKIATTKSTFAASLFLMGG